MNTETHAALAVLPSRPAPTIDLVALDVETGGLDPARHALLSIGVCFPRVQCEGGRVVEGYSRTWFIEPRPGLLMDAEAVAVNGYSAAKWVFAGAVAEGVALCDVIWHLAERRAELRRGDERWTAVGHNAGFDSAFIAAAVARCGLAEEWAALVSRRWECSMASFLYAQRCGLVPEAESGSLDALTAAMHADLGTAVPVRAAEHHAGQDAALCLQGYLWLLWKAAEFLSSRGRAAALESFNIFGPERPLGGELPGSGDCAGVLPAAGERDDFGGQRAACPQCGDAGAVPNNPLMRSGGTCQCRNPDCAVIFFRVPPVIAAAPAA